MRRRDFLALFGSLAIGSLFPRLAADEFKLPLKADSVRFAAIGDMGTGDAAQYANCQDMVNIRNVFPFDFVIMLGDNIYGGSSVQGFRTQIRSALQAFARCRSKVLRLSWEITIIPMNASISLSTWMAQSYYILQKGQCSLFRFRQQLHGSQTN